MDLKHSEDYFVRTLLNKVKLQEIMTDKLIVVRENEPFSRVEELLRTHHIRHLPVVGEEYKLVGILTQRDLYRICPPRKDEEGNLLYDAEILNGYILKSVMTKNPFSLSPNHTVADALLAMVDKKYGCIPIVDKYNCLVGLVTQIDVLRLGARILREGGPGSSAGGAGTTKK